MIAYFAMFLGQSSSRPSIVIAAQGRGFALGNRSLWDRFVPAHRLLWARLWS